MRKSNKNKTNNKEKLL